MPSAVRVMLPMLLSSALRWVNERAWLTSNADVAFGDAKLQRHARLALNRSPGLRNVPSFREVPPDAAALTCLTTRVVPPENTPLDTSTSAAPARLLAGSRAT